MIVLSKKIADELTHYCRTKLPNEACGALIGLSDEANLQITHFIPITNRSAYPATSFSFDAEEWVAVVLQDQNNHLSHHHRLIGTFHTHPTAPAVPSVHDLDTAWGHLPIHLIISLESVPERWFAFRHSRNLPVTESLAVDIR